MAGRPLRPATRRRLGRPSPHQQADRPRAHPQPKNLSTPHHAAEHEYPVLAPVSEGYPKAEGRLLTCYSPVRRSSTTKSGLSARLACVKHAASVRPEPGSNSPTKTCQKTNPGKQTTFAKGISPRQPKAAPTRTKSNWHWLLQHPVEFSNNKHTPATTPHQERPQTGATSSSYSNGRGPVKFAFRAPFVAPTRHLPGISPGAACGGGKPASSSARAPENLAWCPAD